MPFPIVFTSSDPAGGKPSADFSGPILLGKLADNGTPVGPKLRPSGSLLVQSTGAFSNQVVSTGAINRATLNYIGVSTATFVGSATPPPYTGFGAAMIMVGSTPTPHLEVWSSGLGDWAVVTSTGSAVTASPAGTVNHLSKFDASGTNIVDSNVTDNATTVVVTSSVGFQAASITIAPIQATDPSNPSTGLLLYAFVTTSGKTELRVIFPTGTTQTIATEL